MEHRELDNAQRHFGREVKAIDSKSIALLLEQFGLSSWMVFGSKYTFPLWLLVVCFLVFVILLFFTASYTLLLSDLLVSYSLPPES